MSDPIRISKSDLRTGKVEEYIETQAYLTRETEFEDERSWVVKIVYANWFYLSIASMCGGLLAWALMEPYFDDFAELREDEVDVAGVLFFPIVTGCIGIFLGAAEGLVCRNYLRSLRCGIVGLGIGTLGGFIALIPTGIVFEIGSAAAFSISNDFDQEGMPTGVGLLILIVSRGAAWAIAGIPAGIGQGIALRENKVIINGVVGGCLGGLVGGLLFDPIFLVLTAENGEATYSRAVGFAAIGCFVGLFVGLVEGWTKTAWLQMLKGPLAGKQFILFKDTTWIGSSPKTDIYLFKDNAIEPRHARIINRGGRFEIEDNDTPEGIQVNGVRVQRQTLSHGDQIILGSTILEFSLKENQN